MEYYHKFEIDTSKAITMLPRQVGLVVSMSTSQAVSCGFTPLTGHTKDHHKNGTNFLPAWHTLLG